MRTAVAFLALVGVVLAAGCVAPTHDGTAAESSTGIDVSGVGLPVDAEVVFDRVTRLMNASPPRPDAIRVVGPPDPDAVNDSDDRIDRSPAFFEVMDVDMDPGEGLNATEERALENGRTNLGIGTVLLYTGANDSRTIEYILAHEFAHYVQAARERPRQLRTTLDGTTDSSFVVGSLLEGAAVVTTNAYIDAHLGGPSSTRLYRSMADRVAPGSFAAYANERYLLGREYVADRTDGPAAFDRLYANPPRTGEQLIHSLEPTSEPPRSLSIAVSTGDYREVDVDRLGEGFLRIALRNGLPATRAREAAAGWGNDSLRTYRPQGGGEPGYAWVLRFDDGRNQSEFVSALRTSLSSRGDRGADHWNLSDTGASIRLAITGRETVTVLAGSADFLENTTVTGSDGTVSIALPEG